MEPLARLTDDQRAGVLALASAAADVDGTPPLNEAATLSLARDDATHWLVPGAHGTVAYAQWQAAHGTGQLVVHPAHRRRGHGTALLRALVGVASRPAVWAFGDLPAARAFAAASGLVAVRSLLVMDRALGSPPAPTPPPGTRLRAFTDADADAFLALNAAAFAGHPEQGRFSREDLDARRAEPWFAEAGLLLAEDADGLAGFHWTKRHDATTGEVYVLGVHPRAAGRGLGGVLLDAGLHHLAAGGATRVLLYVDGANEAAIALYRRAGFAVAHTDTLYARA